jgi:MSHA biogenesis protein MshP
MKPEAGFSIVIAMFILVVLGLLGSYMVRLSGVQQDTGNYALQGARAYQAARAGIEWAVARINNGGSCADVNAQSALSFAGINGFTVKLSCSSQTYSEGNQNPVIYTIDALSQYMNYASSDYASREIRVTFCSSTLAGQCTPDGS